MAVRKPLLHNHEPVSLINTKLYFHVHYSVHSVLGITAASVLPASIVSSASELSAITATLSINSLHLFSQKRKGESGSLFHSALPQTVTWLQPAITFTVLLFLLR